MKSWNLMNIETIGDKELWVLDQPDWQMPIYAYPIGAGDDDPEMFYCVEPAIQREEFPDLLRQAVAPYRMGGATENLFISPYHLALLAWKAPGVTPEYYLNAPKPGVVTVQQPVRNSDVDMEFINFALQTSKWQGDQGLFMMIWRIMCESALRWIVEKKKPVDFGFCKVVGLPLRANWVQLWVDLNPHLLKWSRSVEPTQRKFTDSIQDARLKAMDSNTAAISWSLSVIPSGSFTEVTKRLELHACKNRKSHGYGAFLKECLAPLYEPILEILKSYKRQTDLPAAEFHQSGPPGFCFYTPDPATPTVPDSNYLSEKATFSSFKQSWTWRKKAVVGKDEGLPEMPPIQLGAQDLRDSGRGDLDQRARPENAVGVPLLHASESQKSV